MNCLMPTQVGSLRKSQNNSMTVHVYVSLTKGCKGGEAVRDCTVVSVCDSGG